MQSFTDLRYSALTVSHDAALANGTLYNAQHAEVDVASGASFFFGILVGTLPVTAYRTELKASSDLLIFNLFEGGAFSLGTDVAQIFHNRHRPDPRIPLATYRQGVTIDAPGTLIKVSFIELGTVAVRTSEIILAADTEYQLEINNQDNQAESFSLDFDFGIWEG